MSSVLQFSGWRLKLQFMAVETLSSNSSHALRILIFRPHNLNFLVQPLQWMNHEQKLSEVQLTPEEGKIRWQRDRTGIFTTKYMYEWLAFGVVTVQDNFQIWLSPLPLNLWYPHKKNEFNQQCLIQKGWQGVPTCQFCDQLESVDHLFVQVTTVYRQD